MKTINILICTDDNYAPYYGIMLTSLFDNNKNVSFSIYLMTEGLTKTTIDKFNQLTESNKAELTIITIDEKNLPNCPIRDRDYITLPAYFRILAPIVNPDIDKILYLDGDIIINGDIMPLWNTDLNNYALAAAKDNLYKDFNRHKTLNIPQDIPYFNSGVLLFNLNYWREHHIMEKCFEVIKSMPEKLDYHDQDTLNIVLQNKILYLPLKYNFQYPFVHKVRHYSYGEDVRKEIIATMHHPVVIHYTETIKPWHKRDRSPYVNLFLYYRKHSLWKNTPLIGSFSMKENIRYYFNKIVWKLHIKKEFNSYLIERVKK